MNQAKANTYNLARPYSPAVWRQIQVRLGAIPSGVPGDNTTQAAAAYQTRHSLEVDGMVGPITMTALGLSGPALGCPQSAVKRGLWYDIRPKETFKDLARTVARIQVMSFDAVSVMIDSAKPTPTPHFKWSPLQLGKFANECNAAGLDFGFTLWPRPTIEHMSTVAEILPEYIDAASPNFIEMDVEGNWEARDVEDFESLEGAGADLVSLLRELAPDVPLVATTFPHHREYGSHATVSGLVDVITPQAYSVYKPSKAKYNWGHAYGPGDMQRLAYARASRIQPSPIMHMGLPAWAQKFPGRTVFDAMAAASNEAARLGVARVWYWSAKWLLRHWDKANERRRFLIHNKPGV
ncbi:MAG: peptidoglycan-binding protein [Rhodospirillaceae bacterium]|nr:peptidoglycan-binding protein [Rhodospirillaceae bacterium]